MITHFLDTNAVMALRARKSDALVERVLDSDEGSIGFCAIVAHELYFGTYKSARVSFNLEMLTS